MASRKRGRNYREKASIILLTATLVQHRTKRDDGALSLAKIVA